MHNRIPFYYPTKTIFLLYLALPQTRGSSYLYITHLQPFFHSHESQIDATLASVKVRVYSFLQERLRALWAHVAATIGQPQQQASFDPAGGLTGADAAPPPSLGDPVSGPAALVSSLWHSYGPSILASGAALLKQTAPAPATSSSLNSPPQSNPMPPPPTVPVRPDTTQSILERRKQLEAELAALPPVTVLPIPPASPSFLSSRTSSESDMHLRERKSSGSGKFEEIEVPSDVEGYDVGGDGSGYEAGRPVAQNRGSWFGWGGSSSSPKGGYERVKSD